MSADFDYTGCVLRSNGKYEGTHWYYILLKKEEDHYLACDHNNFNVASIAFGELDGYDVVPPMSIYKDIKEFSEDLTDCIDRWVK